MADFNVNANVNVRDERTQLKALEDLFAQKRFSSAFGVAKKLKDEFPRSFHIRFFYVRILEELNRLSEAEDALKELMLVFPNNIKLLMEMGKLGVTLNKYDEALDYFNKILFLDPFNSEAKASIDKINIIKKADIKRDKSELGFASYSGAKIYRADTLPEFDSKSVKEAMRKTDAFKMPPPVPPDDEDADEMEIKLEKPIFHIDLDENEYENENEEEENGNQPGTESTDEVEPEADFILSDLEPEWTPEPDTITLNEPEMYIESEPAVVAEPEPGWIPEPELEPEPEPLEEPRDENETTDIEFVTESAAELYLKQNLISDAIVIYEKLYDARKEERFLLKIVQLRRQIVYREKIRYLSNLLNVIRNKYIGD
jgi:tetratricopeptide (TPR) repeat protein